MGRYLRVLAGPTKDILITISNSTDVVKEAETIHQTTPVATAALGRVITATHLMGTFIKGQKNSVTLQILGSAGIKKIFAYADAKGHVKGYISHPDLPLTLTKEGKLDVGGAVGRHGKIVVTRDMGFGEPFNGQADLVSGEIAEDLANYYMVSEQQPSVVSLGVLVNAKGHTQAAGGLMIQTMPGVTEESLVMLEERLPYIRPMSTMIDEGQSLEDMLDEILGQIPYTKMSEGDFHYNCDCTREKVERALITVGKVELKKMIEEDGFAELNCHFCNKKYRYSDRDLKKLIVESTQ